MQCCPDTVQPAAEPLPEPDERVVVPTALVRHECGDRADLDRGGQRDPHGVRVSGATLFLVDAGVDTGPIVAQSAVDVLDSDDEAALHERIKVTERAMLVDAVGRMVRSGWSVHGRRVTVP